uniref:Uncharacterized protein n=1 Tax=Denticeps clupeoides TaxID=299321 RepID=A0A8C4AHS5_9TELE
RGPPLEVLEGHAGGGSDSGAVGRLGGLPGAMIPVHLLICFCRYFRWLTFRLDFTGLSRASLMLLDAESMKLRRSLVVSRKSPSCSTSLRRLFSRPLSMSYSMMEPGKQKFRNGDAHLQGACWPAVNAGRSVLGRGDRGGRPRPLHLKVRP